MSNNKTELQDLARKIVTAADIEKNDIIALIVLADKTGEIIFVSNVGPGEACVLLNTAHDQMHEQFDNGTVRIETHIKHRDQNTQRKPDGIM